MAATLSASTPALAEIAFFDVETSAPPWCVLLEFGAILECPRRLVEVSTYARLVRPSDLCVVPETTVRCNGITRDAVTQAPPFHDVVDAVYHILHGRVWAGHNIVRFDSVIIRKAFAEIGRPPPEPKGVIDTLFLLTRQFGTRAGNMKMASLADYFGMGRQRHRSLDDVRMNIEVLKYCATVLFLEANPPETFTFEKLLEGAITSSQANGSSSPEVPIPETKSSPDSSKRRRTVSLISNETPHGDIEATNNPATNREFGEFVPHNIEEMKLETNVQMYSEFIEPDDVSTECIKISMALLQQFSPRTIIKHKDTPLQLRCAGLKVRFGVNAKFRGNADRPKLNILVEIPDNLCKVLEFCNDLCQKSSPEAMSTSEWRPLINNNGNTNRPMVRLNIPTVVSGDTAVYSTDVYQKEHNGTTRRLVFSKVDVAQLDSLLRWNKVDAFFSLEIYDYQQNAGIRLVAKRLVVHSRLGYDR